MEGICKVSWNEVVKMSTRLAMMMQGRRIFGVKRGGLLVATIMAYHGCKLSHVAAAEVIVDDIADTGHTLAVYTQPSAVLVVRKGCNPMPNYWVTMLNTKDYVLFPWETEQEAFDYTKLIKENNSG